MAVADHVLFRVSKLNERNPKTDHRFVSLLLSIQFFWSTCYHLFPTLESCFILGAKIGSKIAGQTHTLPSASCCFENPNVKVQISNLFDNWRMATYLLRFTSAAGFVMMLLQCASYSIAYSELRGCEDDTEPADEEAASTYIKKEKIKWTWGEAAV